MHRAKNPNLVVASIAPASEVSRCHFVTSYCRKLETDSSAWPLQAQPRILNFVEVIQFKSLKVGASYTHTHARTHADAQTAYWPHMPSFFHIKIG